MKTKKEIQEIVDLISYKDWKFRLLDKADGHLFQVTFFAKDIHSGEVEEQFCRKFYVSPHSCVSEIIRTAYLAVQQAEMHELDENFKFNNTALFDPHLDLVNLSELIAIGQVGTDERLPKPQNETI